MKETKEAENNVPLRLPQSERNAFRIQPAARIPFTVVQSGHHDDALGQMNNGCVGDGFVDAFLNSGFVAIRETVVGIEKEVEVVAEDVAGVWMLGRGCAEYTGESNIF